MTLSDLANSVVYTAVSATPSPPVGRGMDLSNPGVYGADTTYSASSSFLSSVVTPMAGIFGTIVLIMGLLGAMSCFLRGRPFEGTKILAFTTIMGGSLVFAPWVLDHLMGFARTTATGDDAPTSDSSGSTASPSPTPSVSTTAAAEPVQQTSVDWGIIAAIIAVIVTLAIVAVALWYLIPHLNAKQKEAAKKRRVIRETRELHQKRFNTLKALENELIERWVKHHTLEETFRTPALSDNRIPETRAAVIAYGTLLANSVPKLLNPDEDPHQSAYGKSVHEFRDRLQKAVMRAEDIRKNGTHFTPDELADIENAARFIAIIGEGSGATVGEKQIALNRLRKVVERLTFLDVEEAQKELKNQLASAERIVLQLES